MQDDPSIPFENIADIEMDPGFFDGKAPMEVEQGVVEGNEAVGMDPGDDLPRMGDFLMGQPSCRCVRQEIGASASSQVERFGSCEGGREGTKIGVACELSSHFQEPEVP